VTIDTANFVAIQTPAPAIQGIGGLAFDTPAGVLWGTETSTGSLVRVWEVPAAAPAMTEATAMARRAAELFVFDAADQELLRVALDGTVEVVADMGNRQIEALTFDAATGSLLGSDVSTGNLLRISPATGQVAVVGAMGYADVRGLALDPATGTLFGFDRATQKVLGIDPNTGAVYQEATLDQSFADVQDLCWDHEHGTLLGVDAAARMLLQIDPVTGHVSALPIVSLDVRALAYPGGNVVEAIDRDTDAVVRFDRFSGALLP
jgi:DNA-binding beta-propeller fold protein YncE